MNDLAPNHRPPEFCVDLDLHATADLFGKGWKKLSYSKMAQYKRCQASWFFENYCVPLERQVYSEDSAAAIPGTIIQRVWETVINDRVFNLLPSVDLLSKWMRQQSEALHRLS